MLPRTAHPNTCSTCRLQLLGCTLVAGLVLVSAVSTINAQEPDSAPTRLNLSRQVSEAVHSTLFATRQQPRRTLRASHASPRGPANTATIANLLVTQCVFETDGRVDREPDRIPSNSKILPLSSSSRKTDKSTESAQLKPTEKLESSEDRLTDDNQVAVRGHLADENEEAPGLELLDQKILPKGVSERKSECPGAPDGLSTKQEAQADDIPLEQTEHPYDAPPAESTKEMYVEEPLVEFLSPREEAMRDGIGACLQYFLDHPETVVRRGPWALMHATLPFGVETEVIAGNRRVNAIGWMCYNGVCAKQRVFQPTRSGFRTNIGPGVQGHEGQFLAVLAQSQVQSDYPIRIGKRKYKIRDLVQYEMATCREKSELTFKLIGLSHYLDQNQRWRDRRGHTWDLEKMVAEELAQPINGAACGGSHRLMGLSYAVIQRQKAGLPLTGNWKRAESYLNSYVNYAMSLQNPDGSFSTEWFESRGHDRDVERKVQTTGHIIEWLIYTLPDEHLRSSRIQSSIEFLLRTVGKKPQYDWPIGPRGHALRAMALYNQRVFGAAPGKMKSYIADLQQESNLR